MKSTPVFLLIFVSTLTRPTFASEFLQEKMILKGNSELSADLGLGYQFFFGPELSASTSYRYFFADKMALGAVANFEYSKLTRDYSLGLSFRVYFYEVGNWALSLTQNLVTSYRVSEHLYREDDSWNLRGETGLGIHYFTSPDLSLGLTLQKQYDIVNKPYVIQDDGLRVMLGLTFQF